MNDPTQVPPVDPSSNDPQTSPDVQQTTTQYMAYYNTTIIGIFDNQNDANDALQAYQMDNPVDINDVLEVVQISPVQ